MNLEKRDSVRLAHISPIKFKTLNPGKVGKARMFNYSKNGIYFESDSHLDMGAEIYLSIQDSPYAFLSGTAEYYKGKVMWRKKLKDSSFYYGYGIKFISAPNEKKSANTSSKNKKDLRRHQRKPCNEIIMFLSQNGINEGLAKNISASGVFIASKEKLQPGQTITLALSSKNGKETKIKGQIVWANDEGFGVKFLRKI
jgi:Tfp pilus assembly protein PilZ